MIRMGVHLVIAVIVGFVIGEIMAFILHHFLSVP